MDWLDSFLYLVILSVLAFPLGRMIPKKWLHFDRYPFRSFSWENDGKIYNRPRLARVYERMNRERRETYESVNIELQHG